MIRVHVVYALPLTQDVSVLEVPEGTTVSQAIALSPHAHLDLAGYVVAIHGRLTSQHAPLCDQDRIEILRPLRVLPNEARRRRQLRSKRRTVTE